MVKKVVKKKVSMKKSRSKKAPQKASKVNSKKVVLKAPSKIESLNAIKSPLKRIRVAWNSFVFFALLFLISAVSYSVVVVSIYKDLFFLLSLVFGAISVSLILAILVYFFYSKIKISRS